MKQAFIILSFIIGISFTSLAQTSPDIGVQQLKYLKTYPNPVTTNLTISFQRGYNRNYSLQILNTIGKKMYEAKFIPTSLAINIKEYRFYRGIYIYQLLDRNGAVIESGKIMVTD